MPSLINKKHSLNKDDGRLKKHLSHNSILSELNNKIKYPKTPVPRGLLYLIFLVLIPIA